MCRRRPQRALASGLILSALLLHLAAAARVTPFSATVGAATADSPIRERDGRVPERPQPSEYAAMSRWLVAATSWGVLATLDHHTDGAAAVPVGAIKSHADVDGRVFLYLSPKGESTHDIKADPAAAYTVGEVQLARPGQGSICHGMDPQDPTCARVSLMGHVTPVPAEDQERATTALMAKHPVMAEWPADHEFQAWELHVTEARLMSWYGGVHVVTSEDYYATRQPQ